MDDSIFLQDLQSKVTNLSSRIGKTIDNFMYSAKVEMPFEIDREKFIESIPAEIVGEVQGIIPDQVYGLIFDLKMPAEKFNYSWLASKILEAERLFRSEIYARRNGVYRKMTQFDIIDKPACLVAFGGESKAALGYVLDNEKKFEPDMFDEDGYLISAR